MWLRHVVHLSPALRDVKVGCYNFEVDHVKKQNISINYWPRYIYHNIML